MAYTATITKLAANLKAVYENIIFSNPGDIGDTREKEVIQYLTKVMAHKYGFQSGEVFDENDVNCGQVDVIMYDNLFSTVFTDGSSKIFAPVESTYGIISVKSKMGVKELDNAIEGIKRYNNLKRENSKPNTLQIMPDYGISLGKGFSVEGSKSENRQNINCIFAFDTTIAIGTIIKKVKDSGCVDLVIVPGKFLVIGRHRKDFGLKNADGTLCEYAAINTEGSISLFILFLQTYLSRNRLLARNVESLILDIVHQSLLTTIKDN